MFDASVCVHVCMGVSVYVFSLFSLYERRRYQSYTGMKRLLANNDKESSLSSHCNKKQPSSNITITATTTIGSNSAKVSRYHAANVVDAPAPCSFPSSFPCCSSTSPLPMSTASHCWSSAESLTNTHTSSFVDTNPDYSALRKAFTK